MANPNPIDVPPLNIQPVGLLEFFGIKNGAWGPRVMRPELAPGVDLLHWYMGIYGLDFDISLTLNGAITGQITDVPFTTNTGVDINLIPALQTRGLYIQESTLCVSITAGAGSRLSSIGVSTTYATTGVLKAIPMTPLGADVVSDATSGASAQVSQLYPCIVKPGATLSFLWGGNVAATEALVARWVGRCIQLR